MKNLIRATVIAVFVLFAFRSSLFGQINLFTLSTISPSQLTNNQKAVKDSYEDRSNFENSNLISLAASNSILESHEINIQIPGNPVTYTFAGLNHISASNGDFYWHGNKTATQWVYSDYVQCPHAFQPVDDRNSNFLEKANLTFIPNPTSGVTQVILPQAVSGNGTITVFDQIGRVCFTHGFERLIEPIFLFELNLSTFNGGNYLVEVKSEEQIFRGKLIIAN